MNIHDAIVKARNEGWEARMNRDAQRQFEAPQIRRRLVENHLGQRWYVKRIEIDICGDLYYHVATECKEEDETRLEKLITTADRVRKHYHNGGLVNLEYWKKIEFAGA